MICKYVEDRRIEVLTHKYGDCPINVVVDQVLCASEPPKILEQLLKEEIHQSEVECQEQIHIILESIQCVPLLAVLLSILEQNTEGCLLIIIEHLCAETVHETLSLRTRLNEIFVGALACVEVLPVTLRDHPVVPDSLE